MADGSIITYHLSTTHPVREDWALRFKMLPTQVPREPACVFDWKDAKTEATGWVVFDRTINGVSGGGIFMHANATVQETADIARNMSYKFTVTEPQIGGAKAGIKFNHRDPRADGVLRRFIQDQEKLLRSAWVTAGDLNTDDHYIQKVIQEDLGIPTCQNLLAERIAEKMGGGNRSLQLAFLITAPASPYFPLIEGTVGYGLAAAIEMGIRFAGVSPAEGPLPTVAIQGFGAVGSSLALYLTEKKIATVVGISDKDGFVVCQKGVPVHLLLDLRKSRKQKLVETGAPETVVHECAKNFYVNGTDDEWKRMEEEFGLVVSGRTEPNTVTGTEDFLIRFLQETDAEVFSPCAGRYAVTQRVVDEGLVGGAWSGQGYAYDSGAKTTTRGAARAKIIASGANNPFGVVDADGALVEDKRLVVLNDLVQQDVCVVPDWVANSGTAQLFHRGLSLDFDVRQSPDRLAEAVLEACAEPIREFLTKAFREYAGELPAYLAFGATRLAEGYLENPRPLKELVTPNPARSPYVLAPLPLSQRLTVEERVLLCTGTDLFAEVNEPAELQTLFQTTLNPVAYDGFEPSGHIHVAQGIMKAVAVNRLVKAGFTFIFWVADWFALMNLKMGGDLRAIQTVGRYLIETWRATGMDMSRVKFLWASEEFDKRYTEYWPLVIDISTQNTLKRVIRCSGIMGRTETDDLSASQILYPCMQAADIFFLGVDVCQLGMDQRKVNMLAREFVDTKVGKRRGLKKPVVISHHMIPGLKKGQEKASKSVAGSAIFMEDTPEELYAKVKTAFCPPADEMNKAIADGKPLVNPVLEHFRRLVFPKEQDEARLPVRITCDPQYLAPGRPAYFDLRSFAELETVYLADQLHPGDLKTNLYTYLNGYLERVRQHFATNEQAAAVLAQVRKLTATT